MKKTNNKGFSLVELIIVIAIMAILIGVLAPQYIKYVERSRVSADKDLLDSIYTACTTASADPEITDGPSAAGDVTTAITAGTSWGTEVLDTLGMSGGSFASVTAKAKSKSAKDSVTVSMDANGNFTVIGSGANGTIQVPEK
ncbi:MAG: prepilin-type N-terminal cleavage/methylation domain-containing protein [Lachnospiraceae bacterium]|nr:prepilin-type N-terminal cleavage/methylation domain-containing protein [Lachnospiraceae bacterium]